MTIAAPKGLSLVEMQLMNNFATTVSAREINANTKVEKLVLSYDQTNGFTIDLVESLVPVEPPVEPPVEA